MLICQMLVRRICSQRGKGMESDAKGWKLLFWSYDLKDAYLELNDVQFVNYAKVKDIKLEWNQGLWKPEKTRMFETEMFKMRREIVSRGEKQHKRRPVKEDSEHRRCYYCHCWGLIRFKCIVSTLFLQVRLLRFDSSYSTAQSLFLRLNPSIFSRIFRIFFPFFLQNRFLPASPLPHFFSFFFLSPPLQ